MVGAEWGLLATVVFGVTVVDVVGRVVDVVVVVERAGVVRTLEVLTAPVVREGDIPAGVDVLELVDALDGGGPFEDLEVVEPREVVVVDEAEDVPTLSEEGPVVEGREIVEDVGRARLLELAPVPVPLPVSPGPGALEVVGGMAVVELVGIVGTTEVVELVELVADVAGD